MQHGKARKGVCSFPLLLVSADPPGLTAAVPAAAAPQGERRLVREFAAGDVFGEVALLTNAPRQADCVAVGKTLVGRGGWEERTRGGSCAAVGTARHAYCCWFGVVLLALAARESAWPGYEGQLTTSPITNISPPLSPSSFLQCLTLTRDAFGRLMGPAAVGGQLARRVEEYAHLNDTLAAPQDPASPTIKAVPAVPPVPPPAVPAVPTAAAALAGGGATGGEAAPPLPPPLAQAAAGKGSGGSRRRSDHRGVAAVEVQSFAVDSPSFAASEGAAVRFDGEASRCSPPEAQHLPS